MEEPQEFSADNLVIERTIESLDFKKPKINKVIKKSVIASDVSKVPEVINLDGLSQVLTQYVIYIDRRAEHYDQLCSIASNLGATVSQSMDDTVNVVIFEPKTTKLQKVPARYAKKNVKCVPPTWLFACYEENRHIAFDHFPFGVKKGQYTLATAPVSPEEDNPFGLEEVDYDHIEENRPGRQLTMERFLTETMQQEEEEEDEQEEMEQEFYYNRRQETPEESQERKKAVNERMRCLLLDAEKTIKTKKNVARRTKRVDRRSTAHVDDDRAETKIWYGEQSLPTVKRPRK